MTNKEQLGHWILLFKWFLWWFGLFFFQSNIVKTMLPSVHEGGLLTVGRDGDQSWRHKTPTQGDKSKSAVLLITHRGGVGYDKTSQSPSAPTSYECHIQNQRMVTTIKHPRDVMRTHLHFLTFVILAGSLGLRDWMPDKPLGDMVLVLVCAYKTAGASVWNLFCFEIKLSSPPIEVCCISLFLFLQCCIICHGMTLIFLSITQVLLSYRYKWSKCVVVLYAKWKVF